MGVAVRLLQRLHRKDLDQLACKSHRQMFGVRREGQVVREQLVAQPADLQHGEGGEVEYSEQSVLGVDCDAGGRVVGCEIDDLFIFLYVGGGTMAMLLRMALVSRS